MAEQKIRLLIADDHPVVRRGLAAVFAFQPDIEVVGEAEDGAQAVAMVQQLRPEVLLLDLAMPHRDGLAVIRELSDSPVRPRILVLTSFADDERVFAAIRAGALGYMLKDASHEQLLQAVHDVAVGRASLHPSIALRVMRELHAEKDDSASPGALSEREREVLRLIARGLSNKDIAQTLVIHEKTVSKHISSILHKLHLTSRTQAALYALRHRLAPLNDEDEAR